MSISRPLTQPLVRPIAHSITTSVVSGVRIKSNTPVISVVGGGDLLPGVTMISDTSAPWLADGVQIAPASLSLELPWTVAPGAVITQPGSNALTVAYFDPEDAPMLWGNGTAVEWSDNEAVEWS